MSMYDDARARIRGLALNVPVPFSGPDYEIDHEGLRSNIDHWVANGVPIVLLTYGTSEYYSLSDQEIRDVTRTVVEAVAGRAFVVAATGRWWLGQAVEFAHFCEEIAADCLMLTKLPPSVLPPENIVSFHEEVARHTRIPLMLHHEMTGPESVELAGRLADIEHVVAMKQELADYAQYVALGQEAAGRMAVVCGGGAPLAHWAHQFGATASLTGVGQWAPGPERRYVEDLLAGRIQKARRHLDIVLPYRLLITRLGTHACIKHAMSVAGLVGGPLRPPGRDLTACQKAELEPMVRDTLARLEESGRPDSPE